MSDTLPPLPEPDFLLDGGRLRCYYAASVRRAVDAAVAAERERCAKVAENTATCLLPTGAFLSERVAAAIRAET